jgi:MFS family permease
LTIVGLVIFAAGIVVLGVVPAFGAAIGLFTVLGVAQVLCNVSCQTAMQVNVEEQYRARVMSIYILGFFAGTPIGALLAGVLAQLVGLREMIVVFGAAFGLCVLVLGLVYRWYKPLDESLPSIHDSHVVAPGNLPLGTDLDTPAHLVVEPLE